MALRDICDSHTYEFFKETGVFSVVPQFYQLLVISKVYPLVETSKKGDCLKQILFCDVTKKFP